jgi:hypothetical protein
MTAPCDTRLRHCDDLGQWHAVAALEASEKDFPGSGTKRQVYDRAASLRRRMPNVLSLLA